MAIRKPIKLTWEGVEYKIIVNMLLIERIDDEINILSLMRIDPKKPPIVKVCKLIYVLLDEAGADVTFQDVWEGLGDKVDPKALFSVLGEITPMLLPNFNGITKKKPKSAKKKRKVSNK